MNDDVSASESAWQSIAQRERVLLAPYAMHSGDSRGRKHAEPSHPYRGPFQRDRDRIIHSAAFRRLSDKTQVFTRMDDYHRTRLTHTMEVASLARTIGRALALNEDLIEALALVHDIGHPPFGHAGEDVLAECLADEGGFSHNQFGLVIVEQLESRYEHFPGLNLTLEVLEGQTTRVDKRAAGQHPLLESQVVDVADSITYDAHDADDAMKLGIVSLEQLCEIPLIHQCAERVRCRQGDLAGKRQRKAIVHELLDCQVANVVHASSAILAKSNFVTAAEARQSSFTLGPDRELAEQKKELEAFLRARVYRHPEVIDVRHSAQQMLREMFAGYVARPELLPEQSRIRTEQVGLRRAVGDFLAGMTDRFCQQLYSENFS